MTPALEKVLLAVAVTASRIFQNGGVGSVTRGNGVVYLRHNALDGCHRAEWVTCTNVRVNIKTTTSESTTLAHIAVSLPEVPEALPSRST